MWIDLLDEQPEIKEFRRGSGTGCSEPVLVYFGGELDDNGNAFAVWRFRRGGRGDTTSTFWDWDHPIVTHWCPVEAPDD